jgi:hypothetical protein
VNAAFFRAQAADLGTYQAELLYRFPRHRHHPGRRKTNGRTFVIEQDTSFHPLYIFFFKTHVSAHFASPGTFKTSVDTYFVIVHKTFVLVDILRIKKRCQLRYVLPVQASGAKAGTGMVLFHPVQTKRL